MLVRQKHLQVEKKLKIKMSKVQCNAKGSWQFLRFEKKVEGPMAKSKFTWIFRHFPIFVKLFSTFGLDNLDKLVSPLSQITVPTFSSFFRQFLSTFCQLFSSFFFKLFANFLANFLNFLANFFSTFWQFFQLFGQLVISFFQFLFQLYMILKFFNMPLSYKAFFS